MTNRATSSNLLFIAWGLALIATLSAIFIGEVMGQTPCVLCWYQRIAMFPLVVTLGVGIYLDDGRAPLYSLPLALGGLVVSSYHTTLFYGLVPETIQPCAATGPSCSDAAMTVFGYLPLPVLALATFLSITILLALALRRPRP
ncbi:disulfide bond formation protein B [Devosia sp.]|uniref:disulfide bond formation protein B n=1 Tax=Devosia sp. TaxID=1871048 RepID=UPI001AFFEB1B|nr:disulfide bond formation protein B [Devosia sp.]MBO9588800.1 disulfide bond formation protein B [Devosia sp.]